MGGVVLVGGLIVMGGPLLFYLRKGGGPGGHGGGHGGGGVGLGGARHSAAAIKRKGASMA